MSDSSSPRATPKRKRDDLITEQKLSTSPANSAKPIFFFELPASSQEPPAEDGSSSPRTKVANKFRHLSLESGGGVAVTAANSDEQSTVEEADQPPPKQSPEPAIFDFDGAKDETENAYDMTIDDAEENTMRKRHKFLDVGSQSDPPALGVDGKSSAEAVEPVRVVGDGSLNLESVVHPPLMKQPKGVDAVGLKKSYPSINRLTDSKSRARKRAGTPPPNVSRRKNSGTVEEEPVIVDPVRAALTWHEDEITVYDADDKDDDGTGLNGIGFKPTPALAHQRAQKRRQQLSEYRKREENEARARRNQRRREQLGDVPGLDRKHSLARVRFSDAEPEAVVLT